MDDRYHPHLTVRFHELSVPHHRIQSFFFVPFEQSGQFPAELVISSLEVSIDHLVVLPGHKQHHPPERLLQFVPLHSLQQHPQVLQHPLVTPLPTGCLLDPIKCQKQSQPQVLLGITHHFADPLSDPPLMLP